MQSDPLGILRQHPFAVMGGILAGPRLPDFAPVDALPELEREPRLRRAVRPVKRRKSGSP